MVCKLWYFYKKILGKFFTIRGYPYLKKVNIFFSQNIIICTPIESPDQIITKYVVLEIFWSDFLVKKFKKLFLMHPLKMPFCKVGFSVPRFKKRPFMPISKLKSYFANKYLQNKRNRSYFGMIKSGLAKNNIFFIFVIWFV